MTQEVKLRVFNVLDALYCGCKKIFKLRNGLMGVVEVYPG
jgi:hypothetical protein